MNKAEAEQIARSVNIIRPDWPITSTTSVLATQAHRPARDVHLALIYIAHDPATKTPARINTDGPWWHTARLAGVDVATDQPPSALTCPIHRKPEPCKACPPSASLETVRRRIAEARAAIHSHDNSTPNPERTNP